MARSRNIKPGFFKNYDLADLGPVSQLLFAGLWCLADRDGRLEDKPRLIKAELFPYYECDVNGELTKLARLNFVDRYVVDGEQYIQIENFKKHQQPHHTEKKSIIPERNLSCCNSDTPDIHGETTVNIPLIPDSLLLIPDSLIPDPLLPETMELPEWLDAELWGKWKAWKREIGQSVSIFEEEVGIQHLTDFHNQGMDVSAVIRQSITNRYKGFFPLRNNGQNKQAGPAGEIKATTVHQARVLEDDAMARGLLEKKYGNSNKGNSVGPDSTAAHPLQIQEAHGVRADCIDG